ncbi:MAG TPA: flagellar basal body P-ring formation protein FlgA [Chromatiaceae bacterium]|jgi:flagella basal body P-ring formation protein FlgA|nr:flagellar basal body P-ring formation protein FlgA [Chromatiaceae bacterium]HIB84487.1 flagellar basal body P-ring formation protein FlgA [Chromatiaceae bacterium]HIN82709.1 flagellar basal body P-ring formation protein FlgA [Chromatiales bacterium]HIO14671.1 flagellar basal body P-ring formation protein FlgA [Chromatiales bacterium]HIO53769.1 flagellar basal body P-ring formation protein FlgA [Chromatiales bacterium]
MMKILIDNSGSRLLVITGLLSGLLGPWSAFASTPIHNLEAIQQTANAFVRNRIGDEYERIDTQITGLDRRLRLHQCESELEAFSPPGRPLQGNTTVGVRCNDNKPWTLYVQAKVNLYKTVLVTSQGLPRGTELQASHLRREQRDISSLNLGYLTDESNAIGQILKRALRPDAALAPQHLQTRKLVKRGERVGIIAQIGEIEVRMNGKALSDGAMGDRIRIENQRTKRIIEAIVSARGIARVTL